MLYFQGSYWTMDGPAEVNEMRAPKRPYPDEDEEKAEMRALVSLSHAVILTFHPIVKKVFLKKKSSSRTSADLLQCVAFKGCCWREMELKIIRFLEKSKI